MAIPKRSSFTRRSVDHVTDEIIIALACGSSFEFKPLFLTVFDALKLKNAVSGGEEMLRLRCYEKLLTLAKNGLVQKTGKMYRRLEGLEQASSANRMARADVAILAAAVN